MAVVNTITIVKSGGTYADVDEMRTAMRTAMDDEAYFEHMADLRAANSLAVSEDFDAETQTYTITRNWDDSAYATWNSGKSSEAGANRTALESAGFTVDSQITT